MKKTAFIIIIMIILAGFSGPVRSQILDNPPQDVIYYDNDLEDVKPIPIPVGAESRYHVVKKNLERNRYAAEDESAFLLPAGTT